MDNRETSEHFVQSSLSTSYIYNFYSLSLRVHIEPSYLELNSLLRKAYLASEKLILILILFNKNSIW